MSQNVWSKDDRLAMEPEISQYLRAWSDALLALDPFNPFNPFKLFAKPFPGGGPLMGQRMIQSDVSASASASTGMAVSALSIIRSKYVFRYFRFLVFKRIALISFPSAAKKHSPVSRSPAMTRHREEESVFADLVMVKG